MMAPSPAPLAALAALAGLAGLAAVILPVTALVRPLRRPGPWN